MVAKLVIRIRRGRMPDSIGYKPVSTGNVMHKSMNVSPRQPARGVQCRFASHARGGDRLLIDWVGHIAGGENAFDAGQGTVRLSGTRDETLGVQFELSL